MGSGDTRPRPGTAAIRATHRRRALVTVTLLEQLRHEVLNGGVVSVVLRVPCHLLHRSRDTSGVVGDVCVCGGGITTPWGWLRMVPRHRCERARDKKLDARLT